jgi:septum formation protein
MLSGLATCEGFWTVSLLAVSFVLASASPRRAELLTAAGFDFDIVPADVDETPLADEEPRMYALRVARAKAEHVVRQIADARIVLAADTVVVTEGRLMLKPADALEAESMLRALSGRVHEVHTAVVARAVGRHAVRDLEDVVTTRVRFNPLTDTEIAWYIASGEAEGKAGAYGIQGRAARFIDGIEGSWSNVVGLPISTAYRLLSEAGAGIPSAAPDAIDRVER